MNYVSPEPVRLDVERVAIDAAGRLIRLASKVGSPLRSVADQCIRAASSVPLNIAEGCGRRGRDRTHHYRIAYGSAREASVAAELLITAGLIDPCAGQEALAKLDRVRAMLWRLTEAR